MTEQVENNLKDGLFDDPSDDEIEVLKTPQKTKKQ